MSLSNKLNIHTKLAPDKRAKILRWLAKQNEEMILLAFEKQKAHLFKLNRIKEDNRSIIYLSAMYLAIEELYMAGKLSLSKNKGGDLKDIQDITEIQAKSFKKNVKAPKTEKLLNLKAKLVALRNEQNMSYRDISKFLEKFHRLSTSHTTLHIFFKRFIMECE